MVEVVRAYWRCSRNVASQVLNSISVATVRGKAWNCNIGGSHERREAGLACIDECRTDLTWDGKKLRDGGLLAEGIRQNGASSIDVVYNGGKIDRRLHCGCFCQLGIAVGRVLDQENDAFLQNDQIDDGEIDFMLLIIMPRRPVFTRRLSVLS